MKRLAFLVVGLMSGVVGCAERGGSGPADQRFSAMLSPMVARGDSQIGRYVQEVGFRLRTGAKALRDDRGWPSGVARPVDWMVKDVQFQLIEGSAPNAFAAGGPTVYATSGLLRACRSEDEFAAGMAHAYAHLLCHHFMPIAVQPGEEADTQLALQYVSVRFTAEQEKQADDLAVAIVTRGGWSSDAYSSMLQKCAGSRGRVGPIQARLSDVDQRVGAMPAAAADWRQPPVADAKRFAGNQKLAAQATWEAASDSAAIKRARLIVTAFANCLGGDGTPEQARARAELQPPPPVGPGDNPWGKGLPSAREK